MAIISGFDGRQQPFSTSTFSFFFFSAQLLQVTEEEQAQMGIMLEIPLTVWKLVRVSFTHKPFLVAQDLFTLSRSSILSF